MLTSFKSIIYGIGGILLSCGILLNCNTVLADNQIRPTVDLLHFWISDGEQEALSVIETEFTNRGGLWFDTTSKDYQFMKYDALARISQGYPPTALLWLAGEDIIHGKRTKMMSSVNSIIETQNWHEFVYDFILDTVENDNQVMAVPVGLHNENWGWYNTTVYEKTQLNIPKTWDEFFIQAPKLEAAGYMPIATSDEDWSIRLLFTTILAGVAGPDLYKRLYVAADKTVLDEPDMQLSLSVLQRLRHYAPEQRGMSWNAATKLVITGKAAMTVMGDWAKGEFTAAGKNIGKDYACHPGLEADDHFIIALDLFAFPKVTKAEDLAGQTLFSQVVMDKTVQVDFANKKGSVPIRHDINPDRLDPCASSSLSALSDPTGRLFSPRITTSEQLRTTMQTILANFWRDKSVSIADVTAQLKLALDS